jgi:hypothetical protein
MASTILLPLPNRSLARDVSSSSRDGTQTRQSKGRLVVLLPPGPRNYLRSPGVPLEPPSLKLSHDTTAYIIERILLPSNEVSPHDGKPLPKRMTYIIGWRDLPAARRLVPAMDILDYVSPRELEDWEQKLEEELDEAREKLEEAKKKEAERASDKGKSKSVTKVAPMDPKTGKRRRGRPPAHTQIEPGAVVDEEEEGDKKNKGRLKGGALSLSTPQKNRLKDFEGLSDDEEGSSSRQIEKELYDFEPGVTQYGPDDMIADTEAESEGEITSDELQTEGFPSGNSQMENEMKDEIRDEIDDELEDEEDNEAESEDEGEDEAEGEAEGDLEDEMGDKMEDEASPDLRTSTEVSAKASPIPQKTPTSAASAWAAFGPKNSFANGKSPAAATAEAVPPVADPTPQQPVNQDWPPTKQIERPAKPAKPRKQNPEPKKSATKAKKKAKKKAKEPEPPLVDENGELVWVVKRLEDYALFEVEGEKELQRFFKVRWEGDWPEDQNPSWEPEENLPATLVRNYLKTSKKRKKALSRVERVPKAKRKKLRQTTLPWMNSTQYSSVSEAFAAEDVVDESMHDGADQPTETSPFRQPNGRIDENGVFNGDHKKEDEFFVVDEDVDPPADPRLGWNGTMGRVLGI